MAYPDTGQVGPAGNSGVSNRPHPYTIPIMLTPAIQLSKENYAVVSQEVQELLVKGQ